MIYKEYHVYIIYSRM